MTTITLILGLFFAALTPTNGTVAAQTNNTESPAGQSSCDFIITDDTHL